MTACTRLSAPSIKRLLHSAWRENCTLYRSHCSLRTMAIRQHSSLLQLSLVSSGIATNGRVLSNITPHIRTAATDPKGLEGNGDGPLVVISDLNCVRTIRMNQPHKLNAWTHPMMVAVQQAFTDAATDDTVGAVVLTGTGRYYCAGVDLGAIIRPMWPATLQRLIYEKNRGLFDAFLDFPKPLLVAVNGPAVGASVTSATLCDAVVAATSAGDDATGGGTTFNTPFAALGVPYEGCSSVHFERILAGGTRTAERMLGKEGWCPTAEEAVSIGLIEKAVPAVDLMATAQQMAEEWVQAGKIRQIKGQDMSEVHSELKAVNAEQRRPGVFHEM